MPIIQCAIKSTCRNPCLRPFKILAPLDSFLDNSLAPMRMYRVIWTFQSLRYGPRVPTKLLGFCCYGIFEEVLNGKDEIRVLLLQQNAQ
jgi:hypothetical protein